MNIRLATVADIPALHRLINDAYRPVQVSGWTHENALLAGPRISERQLLACFGGGERALLLGEDAAREVVASVFVELQGEAAYISMLSVAPQLQALGLGKRMLEAAEQFALSQWQPRRFLMSVLSRRSELIGFYLRRGYIGTGKVIDFPHAADVGLPKVADLALVELEKPCVGLPLRH